YHPNTVEIQGVPGQLYSRTPQIRVSKALKTAPVTVELAVAAMRPPQRNSSIPEGQGGLRIAVNDWTGMHTAGSTSTQIAPLSVAVTGAVRSFTLPELAASPVDKRSKAGSAIALDAFVPVIPAKEDKKGNSLSLTGEYATGYGIGDMYTGMATG